MIEVIKSPTPVTEKTQWTVFLAGPMNGAPSWQVQTPKVAAQLGIDNVTFLNPRKTERFVSPSTQYHWETFGLRMCDVILFWIPPQAREMAPGRYYALTTRMELAENLARGHKIIFGIAPEIEELSGTRHMKHLAKYYGIKKIHSTLEGCMEELKQWINRPRKDSEKVHHIPTPVFDSMESLKRNPILLNRNQTLMEHWNQTIAPDDTVYVEEDIGAKEWMKFLNGNIRVTVNDI